MAGLVWMDYGCKGVRKREVNPEPGKTELELTRLKRQYYKRDCNLAVCQDYLLLFGYF
jgi:hypothetical protein